MNTTNQSTQSKNAIDFFVISLISPTPFPPPDFLSNFPELEITFKANRNKYYLPCDRSNKNKNCSLVGITLTSPISTHVALLYFVERFESDVFWATLTQSESDLSEVMTVVNAVTKDLKSALEELKNIC
jgi:ABC-type Zn uptake system ZnuABC Zn-binding protein ZnuA